MADCWDDGIIVVPAPNDPWLTSVEIDAILNDAIHNENPIFRHYVLACLQPHIEHAAHMTGVTTTLGRRGYLVYSTTNTE